MEETHPSSADHLAVEGSYTRELPSTATSPEAPNLATVNDNQNSRTPYTDPRDSAPNTASMFSSAQRFNISGQPHFVNIANLNQLSNLGESQGLENFRKSVSPNALHDSSTQELERQVHQVLRKNTLKQLQDWTDNPIIPDHIIWLHGPASIGKTAIALDIAWTGREKVAATFFFSRTDANRNDGNRLFPTLAWQFMVSIPDIKNHIIHSINERPDMPDKGVEAQFEYLIAQPFAAMKETMPAAGLSDLVVIIDGIDECADIRLQRRILKVIGNAIQDPRVPLRFIISSRPDAHIQEAFHQYQCPIFCIDLAKFSPAEEIRKREEEIRTREEEIGRREEEIRKREEEIRTREEEIGKREEEVGKREESKEIGKREEEIRKREEEIRKRAKEIRKREEEIRKRAEEIGKREEEIGKRAEEVGKREEETGVRFLSDVSPIPTRPPSRQQDRPDDDDMNDSQPPESALSGISIESSREASRIGLPEIVRWLHNIEQEALLSPFESPELTAIPTSVTRPRYVDPWGDTAESLPVIPMATQPPANSYQQPVLHPPVFVIPASLPPADSYQQSVPHSRSRWAKRR